MHAVGVTGEDGGQTHAQEAVRGGQTTPVTHSLSGISPLPPCLCSLPSPLGPLSYLIHIYPPPPAPPRAFTLPHAPPARHAPFSMSTLRETKRRMKRQELSW